jgi:hypothetical protein
MSYKPFCFTETFGTRTNVFYNGEAGRHRTNFNVANLDSITRKYGNEDRGLPQIVAEMTARQRVYTQPAPRVVPIVHAVPVQDPLEYIYN